LTEEASDAALRLQQVYKMEVQLAQRQHERDQVNTPKMDYQQRRGHGDPIGLLDV
jgi:hypothetical protein